MRGEPVLPGKRADKTAITRKKPPQIRVESSYNPFLDLPATRT